MKYKNATPLTLLWELDKETQPGVITPFMYHKQKMTFCLFQAAVGRLCPSLSHATENHQVLVPQ